MKMTILQIVLAMTVVPAAAWAATSATETTSQEIVTATPTVSLRLILHSDLPDPAGLKTEEPKVEPKKTEKKAVVQMPRKKKVIAAVKKPLAVAKAKPKAKAQPATAKKAAARSVAKAAPKKKVPVQNLEATLVVSEDPPQRKPLPGGLNPSSGVRARAGSDINFNHLIDSAEAEAKGRSVASAKSGTGAGMTLELRPKRP